MYRFRQGLCFRHLKTWTQARQGTVLRARYYYTLCTDQHLFEIVGIRYMRNYSSYRFALQARLLQLPNHYHDRYLWVRLVFPLSLPTSVELSVADTKFQALKAC